MGSKRDRETERQRERDGEREREREGRERREREGEGQRKAGPHFLSNGSTLLVGTLGSKLRKKKGRPAHTS